MAHPLADTPTAAIPRLIRDTLAADLDIAGFFRRIAITDLPQLEGPLVTPSLLVFPGNPEMHRQIGGPMALIYNVRVLLVLPRDSGAMPVPAIPTAPILAEGASGPLSGFREYRLTQWSPEGESYASEPATIDVTAKAPVLTLPTLAAGCTGFRAWRGEAGSTACRWAGTIHGDAGTWIDTTPDSKLADELAPVLLAAERLSDSVVRTLILGEWLTEAGVYKSDGSIQVSIGGDSVVASRNVRVREVIVQMPSYYHPATNEFIIGGLS